MCRLFSVSSCRLTVTPRKLQLVFKIGFGLGSTSVAPPVQCASDLSRGLSGRGVALTTHPHLSPKLEKEYSYTPAPPLGLRGLF